MAAAGAVVGGLASAYSAYSQADAAKKAQRSSDKMMNAQLAAQDQDLAFRQQQYDKWVNEYETPLVKPLLRKAQSEGPLNLGANWAQIQRNFDTSGRNVESNLARAGMTGSGYTQKAYEGLEGQRASALGSAFSQGLQSRDALRMQLANFGKSMPQQATNLSQGYGNAVGTYGNQANYYGGQATQAGAAAADSYGALGSNLSALGQSLGRTWGSGSQNPSALESSTQSAQPQSSYTTPSVSYTTPGTQTSAQVRAMESAWRTPNTYDY